MGLPSLELGDIQGDVLIGLQKDAECFVFFKIVNLGSFKRLVKQHLTWRFPPPGRPMIKNNGFRRVAIKSYPRSLLASIWVSPMPV